MLKGVSANRGFNVLIYDMTEFAQVYPPVLYKRIYIFCVSVNGKNVEYLIH